MQGSPERTIPHLLGDTEMVSARITELAEGLEGSTGSPEVKQESVLCSAQAGTVASEENPLPFSCLVNPGAAIAATPGPAPGLAFLSSH